MSANQNNCNSISITNNWLGFSLSPNIKMEPSSAHHHHHDHHQYHDDYIHLHHHETEQLSSASSVSMFLSPQQQMNLGAAENGGYFHTPLTVMPLKSDESLCITPMNAFHGSHSQPADGIILFHFIFLYFSFHFCVRLLMKVRWYITYYEIRNQHN